MYPKEYKLKREGEEGGPGASRVPSSLLDKRTLSGKKREKADFDRVLCVTDLSKVGVVDVGWSKLTGSGSHGIKGKGQNPEANLRRAQSRARRKIRTACLSLGAVYILTLTYHENMTARKLAIYHRQEFDRRMKKHYPAWSYVGVLEAQKRGALHWHLAIPFRVDEALALKEWQQVTGDPTITQVHMGFGPDGKGNAFVKCAHYVTKYIGKDMNQRGSEEHRYHIGRGVLPEVQRFYLNGPAQIPSSGLDTEWSIALEVVHHLLGRDVTLWGMSDQQFGFLRAQTDQLQQEDG